MSQFLLGVIDRIQDQAEDDLKLEQVMRDDGIIL